MGLRPTKIRAHRIHIFRPEIDNMLTNLQPCGKRSALSSIAPNAYSAKRPVVKSLEMTGPDSTEVTMRQLCKESEDNLKGVLLQGPADERSREALEHASPLVVMLKGDILWGGPMWPEEWKKMYANQRAAASDMSFPKTRLAPAHEAFRALEVNKTAGIKTIELQGESTEVTLIELSELQPGLFHSAVSAIPGTRFLYQWLHKVCEMVTTGNALFTSLEEFKQNANPSIRVNVAALVIFTSSGIMSPKIMPKLRDVITGGYFRASLPAGLPDAGYQFLLTYLGWPSIANALKVGEVEGRLADVEGQIGKIEQMAKKDRVRGKYALSLAQGNEAKLEKATAQINIHDDEIAAATAQITTHDGELSEAKAQNNAILAILSFIVAFLGQIQPLIGVLTTTVGFLTTTVTATASTVREVAARQETDFFNKEEVRDLLRETKAELAAKVGRSIRLTKAELAAKVGRAFNGKFTGILRRVASNSAAIASNSTEIASNSAAIASNSAAIDSTDRAVNTAIGNLADAKGKIAILEATNDANDL